MAALAAEQRRPVPGLAPRIALRLTEAPITGSGRLAGEGTIGQVLDDLTQLRMLGAGTVVLDPFSGDPAETRRPATAWHALATVSARTRHPGEERCRPRSPRPTCRICAAAWNWRRRPLRRAITRSAPCSSPRTGPFSPRTGTGR